MVFSNLAKNPRLGECFGTLDVLELLEMLLGPTYLIHVANY
jgi:hypothetical protein